MIDIKPASSAEHSARRISEIFVDGFDKHFGFFAKDPEVLTKAFAHMFVLDVFSLAVLDGAIVGIGACTTGMKHSVEPKWKELIAHFGMFKGTIAFFILKQEFHKPPKRIGKQIASVEFIATDSRYRGKGVASALVTHFISQPQYTEYILEVADTNINAVQLYERLGFIEFERFKQKNPEVSGVNYLIYMSYEDREELQQNMLRGLESTLTNLANFDEQARYKRAVPFVHIPWELFAQMEGYARLGREQAWFQVLFSEAELTAFFVLYDAMVVFFDNIGEIAPDVPQIFADPDWMQFAEIAQSLLSLLAAKFPSEDSPPTT